jgi:hypothetical protein
VLSAAVAGKCEPNRDHDPVLSWWLGACGTVGVCETILFRASLTRTSWRTVLIARLLIFKSFFLFESLLR